MSAVTPPATDQRAYRLTSVDMVRGLVIVIMALDHVRDFFMIAAEQDPMANPNVAPALFLTRWITHFCAPVFVLLAGVSAGLAGKRRQPAELARFLFARGAWLVLIEVTVISFAGTFRLSGMPELGGLIFIAMQVIWAIGASMIVLSIVQLLGRPACLVIGAIIVLGHNLLDSVWPASGLLDQQWPLWVALHAQMSYRLGPFLLIFIYPVLPWAGVMLCGYGISSLFELAPERRNTLLVRAGLALLCAFLLLRGLDVYGDPNHWQRQPGGVVATVIDFLNTTKYPPSLQFLLMTLGPAAILCGLADRLAGSLKNVLVTYGRVPFAFYVAHFYVIHVLSVMLGLAQGFSLNQMRTIFIFFPRGYGVSLPIVYLVWLFVVVSLYPWCRWMANLKARRRNWWLSFV
jgi:uncharacterized membrane protein